MHEVARGRVWTGADALAHGLVDELGGLDRAAAIARRRAGLPATAPLRVYPRVRPDRPAPAARLQREPRRRGGAPRSLTPGARPGSSRRALGLSPHGPLMLPGTWMFE